MSFSVRGTIFQNHTSSEFLQQEKQFPGIFFIATMALVALRQTATIPTIRVFYRIMIGGLLPKFDIPDQPIEV